MVPCQRLNARWNDGVQVSSVKDSSAGSGAPSWVRYAVMFTAKTASTTIGLVNADPISDASNLLDDVVVHE